MKIVGIIGAMPSEIELIKEKMEIVTTKRVLESDFFVGKMHQKSVVVVCSGVGKVNAAICTQVLIDLFGADYIIDIGVAGAIDADLNIGDVVIGKDFVQHDMDVSGLGYDHGVIPGMDVSFFPSDEDLIALAQGSATKLDIPHVLARIASGDKFVSDLDTKAKIRSRFGAACVEMEGAAIAQACHLNLIPFVAIRSISDKADDNASDSFKQSLDEAIVNATTLVSDVVEQI